MTLVLDEAEKGPGVIIERKGVLFRLSLDQPQRPPRRSDPVQLEILDADVEAGTWSWGIKSKDEISFLPTRKHQQ